MKIIALILIAASFLAGSFLSVVDPRLVDWNYMIPVLAVGVAGLGLFRSVKKKETRAGHRLAGNIEILQTSLSRILANLELLNARGNDLPVYQARFEIDRLFREDLNNFAEARESMIHVFGIQNYADVMSNFAAGERYINRVWSASTDGYIDEVRNYLNRAMNQFTEGNRHFAELMAEHSEAINTHQGA
ncbi:MAG: hypothetical protein HKN57_14680 [Xanthomonadales bacterium]|nr:hypothetical protein [Gammaproteobacteria bacterium]MBT8054809.1 hypothetical protein [Gammaproteobacteria bacterium]NND58490.1 hypothetical protein [Xanthomonadales bacterium]NNK51074.1 hypothetical protein [Xanthomonadales bacterium]